MRRVLAIRTADKEFGEQLAKQFNKDSDSYFQTFVFSEQDAFESFAKINSINVLLCDEDIIKENNINEVLKCVNAELVLSLSEANVAEEVGEIHSVFKYQASEEIMKEVMYYYDKLRGISISGTQMRVSAQKVCCVCSPVGGAYTSTFALALAYHYSKGGRTLFVSFDPFFSLPGKRKDPREKDLTDVLFYICANARRTGINEKVAEYISSCTIKIQSLEMLNGVSHWFDICDMSVQSIHVMLESTCNTGIFQNVVFDIGIFGAASMEIFMISDKIYVPVNDAAGSKKKIDEWKRQIKYSGRETLLEKTQELHIPNDQGLRGEYDYNDLAEGTLGKYIVYNKL